MHFSVYYRLVDLLWDHLSDEELFRRLAREALDGISIIRKRRK